MRHDPIDPAHAIDPGSVPGSFGFRGRDAPDTLADVRRPPDPKARTFRDRTEAGTRLADALVPVVSPPVVVAAIPRGGVAVALPIVERTGAPLTVVYARKLTAALAPEFAFGALDEDGEAIINTYAVSALGLGPADIEAARARVAKEIRRRMALYKVAPLGDYLPGAAVVLVDDGLATGLTMRAAVAYARRHGAREVTVAVPCASSDAAERFRREADRLVALVVDPHFYAVGAYYDDFSPVEDDEVVLMLERAQGFECRAERGPSPLLVSFKNSRGARLAGELLTPSTRGPYPVVVFAHGWGSSKASPRNRAVARRLVAAGIAAFLFDFTGHGDSDGTADESTQAQQVDDLRSAIDVLTALDEIDEKRIGVVGASSGGAVALLTAARDHRIRALALRSANPEGAERVPSEVAVPTLSVVGERDTGIRAANEALLASVAGPHRLDVVAGGDHLFEDPVALDRAAALTVEWFTRFLVPAGGTVPVERTMG